LIFIIIKFLENIYFGVNLHAIKEQIGSIKVNQAHHSMDLPVDIKIHALKIVTESFIDLALAPVEKQIN
jgi:hypothetical protein